MRRRGRARRKLKRIPTRTTVVLHLLWREAGPSGVFCLCRRTSVTFRATLSPLPFGSSPNPCSAAFAAPDGKVLPEKTGAAHRQADSGNTSATASGAFPCWHALRALGRAAGNWRFAAASSCMPPVMPFQRICPACSLQTRLRLAESAP